MLSPVTRIPFHDFTELMPAFAVVTLISFTYNVAVGTSAGFVLFPFCKLVSGRPREVKPGLWVLAAVSLRLVVFYPYT
jgi:adenine/guanine/hypoxanthine permease